MPDTKKTVAAITNGHRRHGVIPQEQVALLEKQYRKLKTDKARDQFLDELTSDERYYLWLSMIDVERTRERLEMLGLM